jgi:hypothetical protein
MPMSRVGLYLYVEPGAVEAFVNIQLLDEGFFRAAAFIDTGAETSLFPRYLLEKVAYRLSSEEIITIKQAGIAQQSFQAIKAFITIFLEDYSGNRTKELEIPAWFANTEIALLGFEGLLEKSTLYINMRNAREGWIELDE